MLSNSIGDSIDCNNALLVFPPADHVITSRLQDTVSPDIFTLHQADFENSTLFNALFPSLDEQSMTFSCTLPKPAIIEYTNQENLGLTLSAESDFLVCIHEKENMKTVDTRNHNTFLPSPPAATPYDGTTYLLDSNLAPTNMNSYTTDLISPSLSTSSTSHIYENDFTLDDCSLYCRIQKQYGSTKQDSIDFQQSHSQTTYLPLSYTEVISTQMPFPPLLLLFQQNQTLIQLLSQQQKIISQQLLYHDNNTSLTFEQLLFLYQQNQSLKHLLNHLQREIYLNMSCDNNSAIPLIQQQIFNNNHVGDSVSFINSGTSCNAADFLHESSLIYQEADHSERHTHPEGKKQTKPSKQMRSPITAQNNKASNNEPVTRKKNCTSFVCFPCNISFARKHDLQRHYRNVKACPEYRSGVEQNIFFCKRCFKKFARLDSLNRHSRNASVHHGGDCCDHRCDDKKHQQQQQHMVA